MSKLPDEERQRKLFSFSNKYRTAYAQFLEYIRNGEVPSMEQSENIARDNGLKNGYIRGLFATMRAMKENGKPINPLEKPERKRPMTEEEKEKSYRGNLKGFKRKYPTTFAEIDMYFKSGQKLTMEMIKGMAEDCKLSEKTIRNIFINMGIIQKIDGEESGDGDDSREWHLDGNWTMEEETSGRERIEGDQAMHPGDFSSESPQMQRRQLEKADQAVDVDGQGVKGLREHELPGIIAVPSPTPTPSGDIESLASIANSVKIERTPTVIVDSSVTWAPTQESRAFNSISMFRNPPVRRHLERDSFEGPNTKRRQLEGEDSDKQPPRTEQELPKNLARVSKVEQLDAVAKSGSELKDWVNKRAGVSMSNGEDEDESFVDDSRNESGDEADGEQSSSEGITLEGQDDRRKDNQRDPSEDHGKMRGDGKLEMSNLPDEGRQRKLFSFSIKYRTAYAQFLEYIRNGEVPSMEQSENIARDNGLKNGRYVRQMFATMRAMKENGKPINPLEKPEKVPMSNEEREKKYRRELKGFKRKYPTTFDEIERVFKSKQTLTIEMRKRMAEDCNLSEKTIFNIIFDMGKIQKIDEKNNRREESDGEESENGDDSREWHLDGNLTMEEETSGRERIEGDQAMHPVDFSSESPQMQRRQSDEDDEAVNIDDQGVQGLREHELPGIIAVPSPTPPGDIESLASIANSVKIERTPTVIVDSSVTWAPTQESRALNSISMFRNSPVRRHLERDSFEVPNTKRRQLEGEDSETEPPTTIAASSWTPSEDVGALNSLANSLKINKALDTLEAALSQLDDERLEMVGESLELDLKTIKIILQKSYILRANRQESHFPNVNHIIKAISTCSRTLGEVLAQLTEEEMDGMSDAFELDLGTIRQLILRRNGRNHVVQRDRVQPPREDSALVDQQNEPPVKVETEW